MKKTGCIIAAIAVAILLLAGGLFIFFKYYYVVADGVKEGQLNYVTHKGYIFKTYEGKIIQTGFKSNNQSLQSNEFVFTIEDEALAQDMMKMGGRSLQLHYKEYNNPLPWRGYSEFIVDSIVSDNYGTICPAEEIEDMSRDNQ